MVIFLNTSHMHNGVINVHEDSIWAFDSIVHRTFFLSLLFFGYNFLKIVTSRILNPNVVDLSAQVYNKTLYTTKKEKKTHITIVFSLYFFKILNQNFYLSHPH